MVIRFDDSFLRWICYTGEKLGLPLIPAYLSPESANYLTGANFASAGAGVLNDTGNDLVRFMRQFSARNYLPCILLLFSLLLRHQLPLVRNADISIIQQCCCWHVVASAFVFEGLVLWVCLWAFKMST
jgi:hypothetical protein